jgi:hypothetical protein
MGNLPSQNWNHRGSSFDEIARSRTLQPSQPRTNNCPLHHVCNSRPTVTLRQGYNLDFILRTIGVTRSGHWGTGLAESAGLARVACAGAHPPWRTRLRRGSRQCELQKESRPARRLSFKCRPTTWRAAYAGCRQHLSGGDDYGTENPPKKPISELELVGPTAIRSPPAPLGASEKLRSPLLLDVKVPLRA